MEVALLVARLFLAAVFAVAALAKLADFPGTAKSVAAFGVPQVFIAPVALALPLAELITAGLLVPVTTAWWGALSALSLLVVFMAVIAANLVLGHRPDCHCFGQLHSEPVGWSTLARNGVLAAIAGLMVWQGRHHSAPSIVDRLAALSTTQVVLLTAGLAMATAMAVQGWFLFQLLRQHGRLLLRIDALESVLTRAGVGLLPMQPTRQPPAGRAPTGLLMDAPAPAFRIQNLSGEIATLDDLLASGKPVALTFVDPGCGPCVALVPEITRLGFEFDFVAMVLISRGSSAENREKFGGHPQIPVLLQKDREVATAYKVYGTPTTVVVRSNGSIGSAPAVGASAIMELLSSTAPPMAAAAIPVERVGDGLSRDANRDAAASP
ncbi:MauE/DoxX family redox-associated membrane protein [Mesorhizobium ventifaucium]|uniref:Methylamine utilization protein MauE n=1 Tax=Mesorhizobium ventifaucium TaxID=666020 RepID=A0ABN8K3G2_9HYPH|nr:MauE/DoxX family redox-associated membrane protein [Mesorhizobium ventifaucium]CAH2404808.1 Methylamine utilization protein MauE [Mesorhizobium ventifaucium]